MLALFSEGVMGVFIAEASSGTVRGQIGCLSMMSEISPVRYHQGGAIKSDRRQPSRQHIRASWSSGMQCRKADFCCLFQSYESQE